MGGELKNPIEEAQRVCNAMSSLMEEVVSNVSLEMVDKYKLQFR